MTRKKQKFGNLSLNPVSALTDKQKEVLSGGDNQALLGSAGTGKTFLATYLAFKGVQDKRYDRVKFMRSTVSTRDLGFLPGGEKDKISVYSKPYAQICADLFDDQTAFQTLQSKGIADFESTSFIRGMTFKNSMIVVDECQNMTFHELDSIITRLDDDSSVIFCGDTEQADLRNNGFAKFLEILEMMEEFTSTEFGIEDVVRGGIVKSYLQSKSRHSKG